MPNIFYPLASLPRNIRTEPFFTEQRLFLNVKSNFVNLRGSADIEIFAPFSSRKMPVCVLYYAVWGLFCFLLETLSIFS
jgi:hypothetical protein